MISMKDFMFFIMLYLLMILLFSLWKNINPMKICLKLLISVMFVSLMMWMNMSQSWGSMIFLMLFIGGILVIFMMISSLIPSDLMKMVNFSNYILFLMLLGFYYFYLLEMFLVTDTQCLEMKEMINDVSMFILIMAIMLMYFFSVSLILIKEFTSIRYHF